MPRLAPSLFQQAGRISPHLATLLPTCRTIESAQAELRWIRSHVLDCDTAASGPPQQDAREPRHGFRPRGARSAKATGSAHDNRIARLVARRGAGEPLQYVLGTQPFGDLEILCEKGVLIPRPETEAWASTLADFIFSSFLLRRRNANADAVAGAAAEEGGSGGGDLRILDLCSGTGCIGLSLYARGSEIARRWRRGADWEDKNRKLRVFAFDVEPRAVRLGKKNLQHNLYRPRASPSLTGIESADDVEKSVTFELADIFTDEWMASLSTTTNQDNGIRQRRVDILVSNPPYISQHSFNTDTGRNVRNYEPKLALVPGPRSSASQNSKPASSFTSTASGSAPVSAPSCAPEDVFYARLLEITAALRPRITAFEVGDMAQAIRVVEMALAMTRDDTKDGEEPRDSRKKPWSVMEIWRDWPDCVPAEDEEDVILVSGQVVPVRGSGHGRVVFLSDEPMVGVRFANRGFREGFYYK
ncbi:S-adenosyl-L-methionine-dependent methyltransferase [Astrocystis sublimbata]|nr:S-adenosyl-L-methionine-dependent methyltransferase [Astrocystis sublimbata]